MSVMRGAEALIRCLMAEGVRYVFGIPGDLVGMAENVKCRIREIAGKGLADEPVGNICHRLLQARVSGEVINIMQEFPQIGSGTVLLADGCI